MAYEWEQDGETLVLMWHSRKYGARPQEMLRFDEVGGAPRMTVASAAAFAGDVSGVTKKKSFLLEYDHPSLVAADFNGLSAGFPMDISLPANSRVVGYNFHHFTAFPLGIGFGAGVVSVMIGDGNNTGAIVPFDNAVILSSGSSDNGPPGQLAPNSYFAAAETPLYLEVFPDEDHKLSALSVGSVTLDILYVVLP